MKKKKLFLFSSVIVICLSIGFMTGCGKQEISQTEERVQNEADEEKSFEKKDDVNSPEKEADTITPSEENISDKQDDPIRSITVYYVDDGSAEVVGKRVDVSNEFDIWNALKENGILTEDCELLNLTVNESEKRLDLDFNIATGDRIRRMGTTGETEIVGCIVNTYLEAYACEEIRLTEEGEPFVTSHGVDFGEYSGRISFE